MIPQLTKNLGLKSFEVLFDQPQRVYFPDQTVSGRIKLVIESPKRIRGLEFCCKGEAYTSWHKNEGWRNNSHIGYDQKFFVAFEGKEKYFKYKYYLVGGKGQEMELPAGEHVYAFSYILPPVLPSSFEDSKGYVRYTVRATLVRPWKFDQYTTSAFTIIDPLDLNLNPQLKDPINVVLKKSMCCLWCKSGPLMVNVSVPYTGYVPGQTITVTCNIDNASNVQIEKVTFSLRQHVRFLATRPTSQVSFKKACVVSKFRREAIPPKRNETVVEELVIPSLPPSNLNHCNIIDVNYRVLVSLEVKGVHAGLWCTIPVTIGTIPLKETADILPSAPMEDNVKKLTSVISWIAGLTVPIMEREPNEQNVHEEKHLSPMIRLETLNPSPSIEPPAYSETPQENTSTISQPFICGSSRLLVNFAESEFSIPQPVDRDYKFKPVYPVYSFAK